MNMNLKDLTIPQLQSIRSIILNGPVARAEVNDHEIKEQLLQNSTPKEEHCEQADIENKEVANMGDKEKTTESAVEEKVETADPIQPKQEIDTKATQSDDTKDKTQATVSDEFMNEIVTLRKENEELRTYKERKELAELREALLASRKEKMVSVGLAMDESDEEVNRWLGMSEDVFEFTIRKMSEMKTTSVATASQDVKVPVITGEEAETHNNKEIIKRGLDELKKSRLERGRV